MSWQPCLVCSEETTNYCKPCARTNSDGTIVNARFYCDIECRKKDEIKHLKTCRPMPSTTERAIRAGKVAQSLFYMFLENTWTYDMANVRIVRDQHHELVDVDVTDGPGVMTAPGTHTACGRYAGGWLIKFPIEAFGAFDEDAKYALLTDHNSIWAFVTMYAAVQVLFQDLVNDVQADIKEVVHYPAGKAKRIVTTRGSFGSESRRHDQLYPDEDEQGATKGVYEITLKCGSKIALDLAGAQWDIYQGSTAHMPVMYWADYWSHWGTAIKYRIPFRSHQIKHAEKMTNYRMITSQTLITETNLYLNILMRHSKTELGFLMRDLVHMDTETFRDAKQRMFFKVADYLQKRSYAVDHGTHCNVLETFDLRHPRAILETPAVKGKDIEVLPLDYGSMSNFDWQELSRFIKMSSPEVAYKEKKWARELREKRSIYKTPGDWKLISLNDTIPCSKVPVDCVSQNPRWELV